MKFWLWDENILEFESGLRRTEIHKFGQDTGRVFHLLTEQLKLDHGQFQRYFKMPVCQFGDYFFKFFYFL